LKKTGQRRKRYYRLTPAGRKILVERRSGWEAFVEAVKRITGDEYA
jgi:DNA-binding PadR family transcriptional regulator